MADDHNQQEKSSSSQEQDQSQTEHGPGPSGDVSPDSLQKLLDKMVKDIEDVKQNTTSEKNTSTLDKVEKAIDKLSGLLESFSLTPHAEQKKEEEHPAPETPEVKLENMAKFVYVRKRGGRVVKRQVKEGMTE